MIKPPFNIDPADADLAEAALHALVTKRCQRAYAHELRNGLQGIYTGFDVLSRMLEGKTSAKLPSDKASSMVRKSIVNHEHSMEQSIQHLALQDDAASPLHVDEMLNSLTSFLSNDASSRQIELHAQSASLILQARPSKFRLVLLALTTKGMDAMPEGGEMTIRAANEGEAIVIELSMKRRASEWPAADSQWQLTADDGDWMLRTIRQIMAKDSGTLETSSSGRLRSMHLTYRAATPPVATAR
jgi:hypothetical protein